MFQIVPLKYFLWALAVIVSTTTLINIHVQSEGSSFLELVVSSFKLSISITSIFMVLFWVAWRISLKIQKLTYPYVGGKWSGVLTYHDGVNEREKPVELFVRHSPLDISLILESDESKSRTLAAKQTYDHDSNENRIYYIFENAPKPRSKLSYKPYRGAAIMHIDSSCQLELHANYFTERDETNEKKRQGTIHLTARRPHAWWNVFI